MDYTSKLFDVSGKVVVITGGAGLLCGEMSKSFVKAGSKVVILDRDEERGEKFAKELHEKNAVFFPLDAKSKSSFESACEKTLSIFGGIDVLINGAGINAPTPFFEISEKEFDDIIAVHIKGTMFGCQTFGKVMVQKQKGSIINISSASAGPPLSKAFSYSIAKAGVWNLTQNLAREWGPVGVRVNALRPGFFPTEWSRKNFITAERQKAILGHTPMNRYGEAHELVGAVHWLASEASGFVTGSEIRVDGGFLSQTI